jgi:hypothetical protein
MNILLDLRIGTRPALGFTLMLILLALVRAIGWLGLVKVGESTHFILSPLLVKERLATEWLTNVRADTAAPREIASAAAGDGWETF